MGEPAMFPYTACTQTGIGMGIWSFAEFAPARHGRGANFVGCNCTRFIDFKIIIISVIRETLPVLYDYSNNQRSFYIDIN